MSPRLVPGSAEAVIKNEDTYKSPPTSVSDQSQQGPDEVRGRTQNRDQSSATVKGEDSGDEKEAGDGSNKDRPRKRKRSRKGLEKNYACPTEGCGKSYSRAEHLYRHQLNHTPKNIYRCDVPGCERQFVRQDLCTRHRERHSTRGSHLQRKDSNNMHYLADAEPSPTTGSMSRDPVDTAPRSADPRMGLANKSVANSLQYASIPEMPSSASNWSSIPSRMPEPYPSSSNHSTPMSNDLKSPQSARKVGTPDYAPNIMPAKRSNSNDQFYPEGAPNFDTNRMSQNTSAPTYGNLQRQTSSGSFKPTQHQPHYADSRTGRPSMSAPTSAANFRSNSMTGYSDSGMTNGLPFQQMPNNIAGENYGSPNYPPNMSLPSPAYPQIPQGPSPSPQVTVPNIANNMAPGDPGPTLNPYGPTAMEAMYFDTMGNSQPLANFDADGASRSPYAMADDFTAWLFDDHGAQGYSPGGHRIGSSMSVGTSAFVDDSVPSQNGQYGSSNPGINGHGANSAPQQHPMAVNSILDPASVHAVLSEEKRKDLIQLIETQFTDRAYEKLKVRILDGDRHSNDHVLSLHSLQNYISSYWYHFHPQMPMLHKPTFSTAKANILLLCSIICIGASCLDKMQGYEVAEAGADLAIFLAWHLRGEIFKDMDFLPPAKLWVFQTLLLLEIYEKMYADRKLHERAHIHHATTLTLMRRGSSLIGRSALDSPPVMKDEKTGRMMSVDLSKGNIKDPEEWWNHWIVNEATRRVAFAAFIIDSVHATMFGHGATMVAHEMKLALPCEESLWSATSSAEVARIEQKLKAQGVKPMTFFDGLKETLKGQEVKTNSFGRTAIMAGLLSVTWHMNQRDVQIHHLGALKALGGKDIWRTPLTYAFDRWKVDFDKSVQSDVVNAPYPSSRLDEEYIFESRTVLHHLAHMAMHVDVVSCQIFAKATRLLGRTTLPSDYDIAKKRIRQNWAPKPSARHATFFALRFLKQALLPECNESNPGYSAGTFAPYSARHDFLLNRPWVLYYAVLIVWAYGYALDGPLANPPALPTYELQYNDMKRFLTTLGSIEDPIRLEHTRGRNDCLGLLYILRDKFQACRWQLLREASSLLQNCIDMLLGAA